ncbi:MAG TPA: hypothetical protein VJY47_00835 [Candidatus Dojkabacteria bacterium]|nr:hypothetical protein [Candidatus Dojkabacteria bacterium]
MKKFLTVLLAPILALLILGVGLPRTSQAAEFKFDKGTIAEEEIINDNLYIFNDAIDVKGVIRGDLIVFGNNVSIKAAVTGDALIFGNSVMIDEQTRIDGNLTLFGYNTDVKGIVSGNTTVFAYTLKNTASTGQDLSVFAYSNVLTGNVGDDARVFAGTSTIDSNIGGELIINAGQSEVNQEKIGKKIYTEKEINAIAKEQGVELKKVEEESPKLRTLWTRFSSALIGFVSMFIVGALLVFMAPVKSLEITKKITGSAKDFLISLAIGAGILFLAWIPLILIFITVVGIPLGILLLGFLLFGIIFGKVWVNLTIGREILRLAKSKTNSPYLALLVGGGVNTIIGIIPFISGLYSFIATCTALGAMVRMKWDKLAVKKVEKK